MSKYAREQRPSPASNGRRPMPPDEKISPGSPQGKHLTWGNSWKVAPIEKRCWFSMGFVGSIRRRREGEVGGTDQNDVGKLQAFVQSRLQVGAHQVGVTGVIAQRMVSRMQQVAQVGHRGHHTVVLSKVRRFRQLPAPDPTTSSAPNCFEVQARTALGVSCVEKRGVHRTNFILVTSYYSGGSSTVQARGKPPPPPAPGALYTCSCCVKIAPFFYYVPSRLLYQQLPINICCE